MPDIDVTDVLLDPVVAGSTFTVLRRQEVVDNYGISQTTTTTYPGVVGSVQPSGDNGLVRGEDADVQSRGIKVITPFRLRGPSDSSLSGANFKPDRVVWAGDTYEVRDLVDWSVFGTGLVEAECVQVTYVGSPPVPATPPPPPARW